MFQLEYYAKFGRLAKYYFSLLEIDHCIIHDLLPK